MCLEIEELSRNSREKPRRRRDNCQLPMKSHSKSKISLKALTLKIHSQGPNSKNSTSISSEPLLNPCKSLWMTVVSKNTKLMKSYSLEAHPVSPKSDKSLKTSLMARIPTPESTQMKLYALVPPSKVDLCVEKNQKRPKDLLLLMRHHSH